MKLKSLRVLCALGLPAFSLISCADNHVDVSNPTISQMDKLDTQWGLPPRQSKGTPRKSSSAASTQNISTPASGYTPAPASAPAPVSQPTASPAPPNLSVDPSVIQNLR